MNIHFIIPKPGSFVSGGNIFNKNLVENLPEEWTVTTSAKFDFPEADWIWIDGIFLKELPPFPSTSKIGWIIHHLDSLEDNIGKQMRTAGNEIKKMGDFEACFVTSLFMKRYLVKSGVAEGKITVIPPGTTVPNGRLRRKKVIRDLLIVGNIIPRKGILEFLKKVNGRKWNRLINLRIAGSIDMASDYYRKCVRESQILSGWNVIFLGTSSPETISGLYHNSDLLISPALMETFGMSIQEGALAGLPVLALDRGGISEHLFHGQNGYLFDSMNELVDFLGEIIKGRKTMDLEGTRISHYSWSDAANLFTKICEE